MCALFGTQRDVSLIKNFNREMIHDIISQQVSFYKFKLKETEVNIYGESSKEKFYDGPYLFFCLIDRNPQEHEHVEEGVTYNRSIEISFYYDDLKEKNILLEIGDIILYEESYYEVAGLIDNQYFSGKNPEYIIDDNPLNPGLENFGKSISIVCRANYIPSDKVSISPYKERM